MEFLKFFFTLSVALCLELVLGWRFAIGRVQPPLIAAVLFFWFWKMKLVERLVWGIAVGIFMDSLYPEPFGAHIFVFFLLALLIEFLQFFFSNIELSLTRLIATALSVFLFLNLLSLISFIFYSIYGTQVWVGSAFLKALSVSLFWSFLLPPAVWGAAHLINPPTFPWGIGPRGKVGG